MPETTPDGVILYAEALPGNRAQLRADVILAGRVIDSYPVGSPAPAETVERAAAGWNRGRKDA